MRATERRVAHQGASVLLRYPDEDLQALLPVVEQALAGLPAAAADPLRRVAAHLSGTPLRELTADYVATFDLRRRCCPYLTYYTHGDTRKRGMALLRFTHAYRAAGMQLADDELPDHLAVLLEFSATGDHDAALRLLREHRAGLELLRQALRDAGSPYADVLDAVHKTLPPPRSRDLDAALRLAREGPPAEEVGLEPFEPPAGLRTRR
ncbi:MAG: nitrate reductase molybdenum cofactor assembly chaperone [Carbonactinosporaceae bacterium]